MNKKQIMESIKALAKSQGFYGRLLAQIKEEPSILDMLEMEHFKDPVDMILFLEG